jgi:hypothetical protein
MPGYGIRQEPDGLLPWSWAVERLASARTYWLSTVRPGGRPHAMPVWGIWQGDVFYFSTGKRSRKARNLARNSKCVVSVEAGSAALIVEGSADEVTNPALRQQFTGLYGPKYDWDMKDFAEPIYRVRPAVVFAFRSGDGDFTGSATRWDFPRS